MPCDDGLAGIIILVPVEDIEFADDICLISSNRKHVQSKTTKLCKTAELIGLKINTKNQCTKEPTEGAEEQELHTERGWETGKELRWVEKICLGLIWSSLSEVGDKIKKSAT